MTRTLTRRAFRTVSKYLLALLVLTLVAAACGDSGDDATDRAAPAPTAAPQDDGAAGADEPAADDGSNAPVVEEEQTGEPAESEPAAGEEPDDTAATSDDGDGAGEEPDDTAASGDGGNAGSDDGDGAGEEPDGTAATSDDGAGAEMAGAAPARIVSISPTGTEMLFAIGAGDRVVAVDQYSYYPDEAPVTDLDGWNPNIEAIASYAPDMVVMQTSGEVGASLEALGIEVWAHNAPQTFEDVYIQIEQLGAATGQIDEAAALVGDMRAQVKELIAAAPDASGLTYYHELDNTLYTVTSSTFVGQVYGLFGLTNVADPADADGSAWGYPQLSDEYLVDADPDIIFLADTVCCGQDAQTVAARPGWDGLTAVQTGRIVELNDDTASRWGPRLVDFIASISEVLVSIGAAS